MVRIDTLEVGQRFRQTLDYDETRAPIVTTGTLLYKNNCRVLVQPDGQPREKIITFGTGRTITVHERPKPQTWPLEVDVEVLHD